jgi:glycogen phosphorylase
VYTRTTLLVYSGLRAFVDDEEFQDRFMAIKHRNKERLARLILRETGITVSPDAMFDVQVKRLHEYKRQLMNILSYGRYKQYTSVMILPSGIAKHLT